MVNFNPALLAIPRLKIAEKEKYARVFDTFNRSMPSSLLSETLHGWTRQRTLWQSLVEVGMTAKPWQENLLKHGRIFPQAAIGTFTDQNQTPVNI